MTLFSRASVKREDPGSIHKLLVYNKLSSAAIGHIILNQALLILMGGGIGSLSRHWLSLSVYSIIGRSFPYGTLAVNVLGSFVMGILAVLLLERFNSHAEYLRAFLLIGFLGGFTTFSSFSIETVTLLEGGELLKGLLNILASVTLCLFAAVAGTVLGRQI